MSGSTSVRLVLKIIYITLKPMNAGIRIAKMIKCITNWPNSAKLKKLPTLKLRIHNVLRADHFGIKIHFLALGAQLFNLSTMQHRKIANLVLKAPVMTQAETYVLKCAHQASNSIQPRCSVSTWQGLNLFKIMVPNFRYVHPIDQYGMRRLNLAPNAVPKTLSGTK